MGHGEAEHGWWEFLKLPPMFLSFSSFASLGPLGQATGVAKIDRSPPFPEQEKRSESFLAQGHSASLSFFSMCALQGKTHAHIDDIEGHRDISLDGTPCPIFAGLCGGKEGSVQPDGGMTVTIAQREKESPVTYRKERMWTHVSVLFTHSPIH